METGTHKLVCGGEKSNKLSFLVHNIGYREGGRRKEMRLRMRVLLIGCKKNFVQRTYCRRSVQLNLLHLRWATKGEWRDRDINVSSVLSSRGNNRYVIEKGDRETERKGHILFFTTSCMFRDTFICFVQAPGWTSISKEPLCCFISAWAVIISNKWKKKLTPDPLENCSLWEHIIHVNAMSLSVKPQPQFYALRCAEVSAMHCTDRYICQCVYIT